MYVEVVTVARRRLNGEHGREISQFLEMSDNIFYRIATVEDIEELRVLLTTIFTRDEPFNKGWVNDDPVPEDIEFALSEGLDSSFVAVDLSKKKIVGACMTCVEDRMTVRETLKEADYTPNKKWAEYLRLYARLDLNANIFERYEVDRLFHVSALAVDSDYRGLSIAKTLVQKAFELAKAQGHKLCSINCSSVYTEKIAKCLKMECVASIAMADVKDSEGRRLIFPEPPHTHIRTYAKKL